MRYRVVAILAGQNTNRDLSLRISSLNKRSLEWRTVGPLDGTRDLGAISKRGRAENHTQQRGNSSQHLHCHGPPFSSVGAKSPAHHVIICAAHNLCRFPSLPCSQSHPLPHAPPP